MSSQLRKGLPALALALVPLTPLTATAAPTQPPPLHTPTPLSSEGPEADLAHHGRIVYTEDGRLTVRLRTWNHGPVSLDSAAVRVSFSHPVVGGLPDTCRRSGAAVVVCETGPLRAGSTTPHPLDLTLRVPGSPAETVMDIRTVRMGSAELRPVTRDLNPDNDRQRVLAPATGDPYYF
ncbi:hypothetical protein ACFYVL_39430 [Streptomyces sp. NPDC004111]|uniref:hypothetical protein n=1 Tax=Streptomyces sp. NPDC004111 TaxID=3364690 RepID=UPI00369609EB